jgi:hypothetical protein
MYKQTYRQIDGWMDDGLVGKCVDRWMDDGLVGKCVDGWMHA